MIIFINFGHRIPNTGERDVALDTFDHDLGLLAAKDR